MKPYIITIVAAALLFLGGCAPCRHVAKSEQRDSVLVEVQERVIFKTDTLFLEVPAQEAERVTRDSTSHLENDFATSDARINEDGSLYHDLKSKPQKKPVEVQTPTVQRDSVVYRERVVEKEITVEVERDYTWWDKTRFYGFYGAIIFLMIIYRREILELILRCIRKK